MGTMLCWQSKKNNDVIKKFISYFLATTVGMSPLMGYAQERLDNLDIPASTDVVSNAINTNPVDISYDDLSIKVTEKIPASEVSKSHIPEDSAVLMMTPKAFNSVKKFLNQKLWKPLKSKVNAVYAYTAENTPDRIKEVVNAFRDPTGTDKSVTIVTTAIGAVSTVSSFLLGNELTADPSLEVILVKGVVLTIVAVLLRANYTAIGDYLNFKGWNPKNINKNIKDKLYNRILKTLMVELVILSTVTGVDVILNQANFTDAMLKNFVITNIGYTLYSFVDNVISRVIIEKHKAVIGETKEDIERQNNIISFKYKLLSIGLGFVQNVLAVYAMLPNHPEPFQIALTAAGVSFLSYEYIVGKMRKNNFNEALTCGGVFAR